jgi:hypothetical protein
LRFRQLDLRRMHCARILSLVVVHQKGGFMRVSFLACLCGLLFAGSAWSASSRHVFCDWNEPESRAYLTYRSALGEMDAVCDFYGHGDAVIHSVSRCTADYRTLGLFSSANVSFSCSGLKFRFNGFRASADCQPSSDNPSLFCP